jgi:hypothetical protein
VSSAYRKPDTCWQHDAALNGGMTYSNRARTTTLWPRAAAFGMVAAVAMTAAGCGGTQSSSSSTSTASHSSAVTPREKAVKFSECMHANGVSDFPDPNASGEFPSYGISVSKAVWKKAVAACKALQPPGTLSAKLSPTQLSAAIKFAQCIRENGVPDFPDPVNGQPLVDTTRIPSSNKPGGMTILNAAMHTCGHFVAEQTGGQ